MGFDTRSAACFEQIAALAYKMASDAVRGADPYWLTILGTSGLGKTMIAKRIFRFFADNFQGEPYFKQGEILRHECSFRRWRNMVKELHQDPDCIFALKDKFFLALDDIGSEHEGARGWGLSELDMLLDNREPGFGRGKWTVITSNLTLAQIGDWEARIASRMIRGGSKYIELHGTDYNLIPHCGPII